MPQLFDEVMLLVDREVIGAPIKGTPTMMPRGSRGILMDQNTAHPRTWIIEFPTPIPGELLLVEAEEGSFAVCEERRD